MPGHGELPLTAVRADFDGLFSGLEHRGKLDGNADLQAFAQTVERVSNPYHTNLYPHSCFPLSLFILTLIYPHSLLPPPLSNLPILPFLLFTLHSPFAHVRLHPTLPSPLFQSCIEVVENGIMTKDLAGCVHGGFSGLQIGRDFHTTDDFMQAIDEQIQKNMA